MDLAKYRRRNSKNIHRKFLILWNIFGLSYWRRNQKLHFRDQLPSSHRQLKCFQLVKLIHYLRPWPLRSLQLLCSHVIWKQRSFSHLPSGNWISSLTLAIHLLKYSNVVGLASDWRFHHRLFVSTQPFDGNTKDEIQEHAHSGQPPDFEDSDDRFDRNEKLKMNHVEFEEKK